MKAYGLPAHESLVWTCTVTASLAAHSSSMKHHAAPPLCMRACEPSAYHVAGFPASAPVVAVHVRSTHGQAGNLRAVLHVSASNMVNVSSAKDLAFSLSTPYAAAFRFSKVAMSANACWSGFCAGTAAASSAAIDDLNLDDVDVDVDGENAGGGGGANRNWGGAAAAAKKKAATKGKGKGKGKARGKVGSKRARA